MPGVTMYDEVDSGMPVDVEMFYSKYGPMVLRRCRFLLRDEESAFDAMQDVFVQVLRRKESLDDAAPSSLLYRIATNVCLNIIRSRNRRSEVTGDDIIERMAGSDDPEERVLNDHFLDRIFEIQKPSTRAIAVYHYVDKMTLQETAELVNMSVSGVRKRLRTLRADGLRLREV
jgi:RNA polymerase sigma-70 factor, ECF subfamily